MNPTGVIGHLSPSFTEAQALQAGGSRSACHIRSTWGQLLNRYVESVKQRAEDDPSDGDVLVLPLLASAGATEQ